MSGIIGSKINVRASGLVAKLGTDGQLLTSAGAGVPLAFEAGGGGLWTKILSQEITSATASMDFVDGAGGCVFDSTYQYYMVHFRNMVSVTADKTQMMQITTDTGGSWKTSGYETYGFQIAYDAGQTGRQARTTNLVIINQAPTATGKGTFGFIMMDNPSQSKLPTVLYYSTGGAGYSWMSWFGGGTYMTSGAYDGFRFIPQSGDLTTLQATLYGHID